MGTARAPGAVKRIAGVLASSPALLEEARGRLGEVFGDVDASSEPGIWDYSEFYAREMGRPLWRQFVSVAGHMLPDALPDLKHATNEMERIWSGASGRRVNLDPGYLDLDKLALASTKNAAHRIYLRDGIYAEATLFFSRGSFRPYAYTYPDYAAESAIAFFNEVHRRWKEERRPSAE